ncbi:MAG: hypothetical protein ACD_81C00135G0008 [uncultured bacterium]|uniref:tRNA (guanine-N(1)-)-methyltransferase n=2 Tax=Candidatus Wolfeibacteriota TaxID=1752735 RepID=A0A0G1H8U8_9BACT|nr:MAG: hypothetical protein ACD_81C00135G0008 [uncultured bacterium]KKR12302.1 MAG: tRNA (guanine-N(1)-)-methyltransferase [Candidatus Wolfebacteria bacterium GW2011_GWC2_39_22]KKT43210.1 MAG: tRNA (guanine-N(1)-)-methyltransferase [Candidatus Wolfebacteria bacterium GW2011_GWE2_44_13]HBI25933.1 tRNA (guanosine(37)-N1)-methyltransferase TrmD [Candidatus Wolfebacteria bacterium]
MRFDIITIFPNIFDSYFNESILKRAKEKKLLQIYVHDLRAYATDKHHKTDDRPFGGGPGMVMKVEPLVKAITAVAKKTKKFEKETRIIFFAPGGKLIDDEYANKTAKKVKRLILICAHYEGMDDRVKKIVKDLGFKSEELSIGPYVLTGGELPAMVMVDALARKLEGVLGKGESLEELRHGVGVPAFTRPSEFVHKGKKYKVPPILLSGDHKKIDEWRAQYGKKS